MASLFSGAGTLFFTHQPTDNPMSTHDRTTDEPMDLGQKTTRELASRVKEYFYDSGYEIRAVTDYDFIVGYDTEDEIAIVVDVQAPSPGGRENEGYKLAFYETGAPSRWRDDDHRTYLGRFQTPTSHTDDRGAIVAAIAAFTSEQCGPVGETATAP